MWRMLPACAGWRSLAEPRALVALDGDSEQLGAELLGARVREGRSKGGRFSSQ